MLAGLAARGHRHAVHAHGVGGGAVSGRHVLVVERGARVGVRRARHLPWRAMWGSR